MDPLRDRAKRILGDTDELIEELDAVADRLRAIAEEAREHEDPLVADQIEEQADRLKGGK